MYNHLSPKRIALVRNATCVDGGSNPFSGGSWTFDANLGDLVAAPCPFPYAPSALATSSDFAGDDYTTCNVIYADLIWPHHTVACSAYGFLALVLTAVYVRYFFTMNGRRSAAMRALGTTFPIQKIYLLGALASFAAALMCVDLEGYGGRYPVWAYSLLLEVATGLVHCALFVLMTLWIRMAQRRSDPWRDAWLGRLQYASGGLVTVCQGVGWFIFLYIVTCATTSLVYVHAWPSFFSWRASRMISSRPLTMFLPSTFFLSPLTCSPAGGRDVRGARVGGVPGAALRLQERDPDGSQAHLPRDLRSGLGGRRHLDGCQAPTSHQCHRSGWRTGAFGHSFGPAPEQRQRRQLRVHHRPGHGGGAGAAGNDDAGAGVNGARGLGKERPARPHLARHLPVRAARAREPC